MDYYLADSMSICANKYFLQNIEDEEIKKLVIHELDLAQQHTVIIRDIFTKEKIAIHKHSRIKMLI
nr:DUF3231 family protein [Neobacillus dielmonensis]